MGISSTIIKLVIRGRIEINKMKKKMTPILKDIEVIQAKKTRVELVISSRSLRGKTPTTQQAKSLAKYLNDLVKVEKKKATLNKDILKWQKRLLPGEKKLAKMGVNIPI